MSFKPIVLKDFLDENTFKMILFYTTVLKRSNNMVVESRVFKRRVVHNHPAFHEIHHKIITPIARKIFNEDVKPSYSLLSCYEKGHGVCPVHTDRPQCFRTIDLCIDQVETWPLYVNENETYRGLRYLPESQRLDENLVEEIKKGSTEFILRPGEALCYSGTDHPHWRNEIQKNNFCDLLFFHFVSADFEGELD